MNRYIHEAIAKLQRRITEHMRVYDVHGGEDNKLRLTGAYETCRIDECTWGVANRTVSVRIPKQVSSWLSFPRRGELFT